MIFARFEFVFAFFWFSFSFCCWCCSVLYLIVEMYTSVVINVIVIECYRPEFALQNAAVINMRVWSCVVFPPD